MIGRRTEEFREAQAMLAALADGDLLRVWRALDPSDARVATDALLATVPEVVAVYGEQASVAAAEFYDDLRAEYGPSSRFRARAAAVAPRGQVQAAVRWAVTPMWADDARLEAVLARLAGSTRRLTLQPARSTVADNAVRDPAAAGWHRVTGSGACKFCQMLAGRGAVYTESATRFASHDNCNCSAVPAFDPGRSLSVEQYRASKRNITEADRARVREFMSRMD